MKGLSTILSSVLKRALEAPKNIPANEIAGMLSLDDSAAWEEVFAAAREVRTRCGKDEILPRGLIECSNICAKDCLYCGIRRSNAGAARYRLSEDEVRACCDEARRRGYHAVAFQAGEIESEANTRYYENLIGSCRDLEVTLSLGEQTEEVYRRWKTAGGDVMRYLIRIETSNRELYAKLHPPTCSFDRRVSCIRTLKRLGYVTGTGVMIGLPGQTVDDLARDIVFFGDENVDMVGMGPYIAHPDTPLHHPSPFTLSPFTLSPFHPFTLSLRMIALTRIYLHDVNIVAATALEALDPGNGRQRGLDAGANVIMPNLTPAHARDAYSLYPGKTTAE